MLRWPSLVVALLLALSHAPLHAQRTTWNWYFGSNAGVTFANGIPEPLTDGRIDTDEGCAVASSPVNGSLLFYTDGHEVRNSFHQVMPNGTGLQGERSTSQSALIVPWPGSSDLYAIFNPAPITAVDRGDRCLCLAYSVVDMRRDAGFGDVIVKNTFVTDDVTEHVTATRDCEGTGWWIIVRKREASSFYAYHFTADGMSETPVVSPAIPGAEIRDAGQMHVSPSGDFVVITSPSGSAQVYRFMRSTGKLFHGIDLFGDDRSIIHYGASFTVDSRYLYIVSIMLTPTEGAVVTRFDMTTYSQEAIRNSKQSIGFLQGSSAFTPMQLGPDHAIYIGRPNEKFLSSIPSPSQPTPGIVDTAVRLTGVCRSGLPLFLDWNFAPHLPNDPFCNLPVAFAENKQVCANECVQLIDQSQGSIHSWSWNIPGGKPTSPRLPNPVVCFSKPGVYHATLTVSNNFGDDTTDVFIEVTPPPAIALPVEISTCPNTAVQLHVSGAASYQWSPTQGLDDPTSAHPFAVVNDNTVYTVVGTSPTGCKDTASITILVQEPTGGNDATICPGGSTVLHASGADTYQWAPSTNVSDPSSSSPVVSPLETTEYTVTMQRGTCVVIDTVRVTVAASFTIAIEGPNTACVGDTLLLHAVGGGASFQWSGDGVAPSTSSETLVTVTKPTTITVVATSGGCSATASLVLAVQSGPETHAPADTTICYGSAITLRASGNARTYEWYDANGMLLTPSGNVTLQPGATTLYMLNGYGQGTCVTVDTVQVVVLPPPDVHAGANKRLCKGSATRLSATGVADAYMWEPATGLDDPTLLAPIASPDVTTTYRITAVRGGCVSVDSTTVYVSELKLEVPETFHICAGSSSDILIGGAMSYSWDPPEGLSDPTIPNPTITPTKTTTYRIIGRDAFGCEDHAFLKVVVTDTSSVTIRAATVTAPAGTENLEIPIIVDVDPALLPIFADSLRADIVVPKDVLIPSGFDRGRPSISIRGDERIIRLVQPNVQIVNQSQRINSLYGTVLAGTTLNAPVRFEKVSWVGVQCPTSTSIPGRILVTGCYIEGRALRFYDPTGVTASLYAGSSSVEIDITGNEPGSYNIQLVSSSGAVVAESRLTRPTSTTGPIHHSIPMDAFSAGLYFVVTTTQSSTHVHQVYWLP